jgi:hypothetical protein
MRLVTYIAFSDKAKAVAFERYMKTASAVLLQRSVFASQVP